MRNGNDIKEIKRFSITLNDFLLLEFLWKMSRKTRELHATESHKIAVVLKNRVIAIDMFCGRFLIDIIARDS